MRARLTLSGDENCDGLPENWSLMSTDSQFPVASSSAVSLKCGEGSALVGDNSVVCVQQRTFQWVVREPRCVRPAVMPG